MSATTAPEPEVRDGDAFARAFIDFWKDPSPEKMHDLLTDDAVLIQPLAPRMEGIEAAKREFAKIFGLIPDLHAEIDRWVVDGDLVFIEFRLMGTISGRPVSWRVVDRFFLRDGYARERVTWFDTWPLLVAVLRTPSAWVRWWRSGAGRPWAS